MAPAEFVNPLGHAGERGQPLPVKPFDPDASARSERGMKRRDIVLHGMFGKLWHMCNEITTIVSVRLVFKVRNVPMVWCGCYFSYSGYIICCVQYYFWLPTQKSSSVYY